MNLSSVFIARPVTTTLLILGLLVFGTLSYQELPVADLPSVDFPTIRVSASLPGASPETMASSVALPLEKQFAAIPGLTSINSSSTQGGTDITLQFDLSRNIDAAAQDVQSMIGRASRQLPPQMPSPPSYQKVNPADQSIFFIILRSPTLPLSTLDEIAQSTIGQRISMVNGVAQVNVFGSQKYAVRIDVDPRELASRSIGIDEVASSIQNANSNLPTGTIYGEKSFVVQTNGQLMRASAYGPSIIAYRGGNPVRLDEVAHVYDGVENDKTAAWSNGERCIYLPVMKQPGVNVVEVVDSIKAILPAIEAQLPASVTLDVRSDRSLTIKESVHDVKLTLLITVCLVVLVIFLFLRNLSATIIPSLALPASLIGTFTVMYLLGYSLDNLSLMALTLSVGFVVDDAIVMLENIVRHIEKGESVLQAAINGSREIAFTVVSMTLSLVAVFIPVLYHGGLIGRLFQAFAVTIGVAILVSGIVSLTLSPMLCSRWLKPHEADERHGKLYTAIERGWEKSLSWYERSLQWVMDRRGLAMAFSALILVGTVVLARLVPKGFIPSEDQSRLTATTETAEGTSYDAMVKHQQAAAAIVQDDPNVNGFMSAVGGGGRISTVNQGRLIINLKDPDEREMSADEVARSLTQKLAAVPGLRVFISNPPVINIGGRSSKSEYQFTLQSSDMEALYEGSAALERRLQEVPGLTDVTSDLQIKNPQVQVAIDRDRAAALGIDVNQIESALYNAYGARQVSTIFTPNDQYWVVMELLPQYQRDLSAMNLLHLTGREGVSVPLGSLAKVTPSTGPLTVNHSGQLPSVTLSFNLVPGTSIGTAVDRVQTAAREVLPSTISTSFAGTAQAFQAAQQGLLLLLVLAILVIYLVLGILYESFVHPLTILSGLPFAGFGALVALMVFQLDLSIYAFVGIIMLVGIVKKNAIMMIDFAIEAERREHTTARQARSEERRVGKEKRAGRRAEQ